MRHERSSYEGGTKERWRSTRTIVRRSATSGGDEATPTSWNARVQRDRRLTARPISACIAERGRAVGARQRIGSVGIVRAQCPWRREVGCSIFLWPSGFPPTGFRPRAFTRVASGCYETFSPSKITVSSISRCKKLRRKSIFAEYRTEDERGRVVWILNGRKRDAAETSMLPQQRSRRNADVLKLCRGYFPCISNMQVFVELWRTA